MGNPILFTTLWAELAFVVLERTKIKNNPFSLLEMGKGYQHYIAEAPIMELAKVQVLVEMLFHQFPDQKNNRQHRVNRKAAG